MQNGFKEKTKIVMQIYVQRSLYVFKGFWTSFYSISESENLRHPKGSPSAVYVYLYNSVGVLR